MTGEAIILSAIGGLTVVEIGWFAWSYWDFCRRRHREGGLP